MVHFNEITAMKQYLQMLGSQTPFFLDPDYSLERLAEELHTNRAYASHFVNNKLGTSFPTLLRSLRIAYAERLMHNCPKMRITEVARQSGFSNATTFRRAWKDKHDVPPRQFQ